MSLTLDFIVEHTGGKLLGTPSSPVVAESVVIDSRTVTKNSLFACIKGENTDGHNFADMAVEKGCSVILAEHNPFASDTPPVPVVMVNNTEKALQNLAAACRERFAQTNGHVIALTGTAGKTTVKELLTLFLSAGGVHKVSATPHNLNNGLGVPLSILNADEHAAFWVIEVGISHVGDMEELGAIVRPDIALLLNAGAGHTQGLGRLGVAHHKAQLLRFLQKGGKAVVNADYPDLVREARAIRSDMIFFTSSGKQVEYRARYLKTLPNEHGQYRLWLRDKAMDIEAPFNTDFATENLVAAATVAYESGISEQQMATAVLSFTQPEGRFRKQTCGRWTLIDDCYNANPLSMAKSLAATTEIRHGQNLICVLGVMGELGEIASVEHEKLGALIAEIKPTFTFWIGDYFDNVNNGFEDATDRWHKTTLCAVDSPETFIRKLKELSLTDGIILFKGSRANKLERFITAFQEAVQNHVV